MTREQIEFVLDHYGRHNQIVKCVEGLTELSLTLQKFVGKRADHNAVVSDLADASNLIQQMIHIFDVNEVVKVQIDRVDHLFEKIDPTGRVHNSAKSKKKD